MTFQEPKNKNYCAIVVSLEHFVTLPNCDNVKAAIIFGSSVIVSKDTQAGTVGLFFPVETALSAEFLGQNNLFRKPELGNIDPEKKGYFEQHGRVKAVLFRKNKSEGFWIPLESLAYLGLPLSEFPIGTQFDFVNEHEICKKYIPKRNRVSNPCAPKGKKARVEDKLVDGQFRFHIDTAQLRRNMHRMEPSTLISISDKWHGTSAIYAHILVQRELNWFEKALRWVGTKLSIVQVQETEYGFTWASRRVIKGVDGEAKKGAVHFYSTDIWGVVAKEIETLVPKGFTVYGEIVGYMPEGGPIQQGYHYGCQPGTHRFLVYRITSTNADGKVIEMSWPQMKEFCFLYGLEMVKELFYGRADQFFPMAAGMALDEWQEGFLKALEAAYVHDQMCQHNNLEVPAEGVVVRVERLAECESYKCKSFLFLKRESEELDKGEIDVETEQSEGGEEVEVEA